MRDGQGEAENGNPFQQAYDPAEFARGGVNHRARATEDDDTDSDGSILNGKGHQFALELILPNGEHHGVQYGGIMPFPFMNTAETMIRFLCLGRKWEGGHWQEEDYDIAVTGERLGRIYVKLLAGSRAVIKVTGRVEDDKKSQVDSITMERAVIEGPTEG